MPCRKPIFGRSYGCDPMIADFQEAWVVPGRYVLKLQGPTVICG